MGLVDNWDMTMATIGLGVGVRQFGGSLVQSALRFFGPEDVAEQAFATLGKGLKNVRSVGSGRLGGYLRGNTNLPGGDPAARQMFQNLTGRLPTNEMDRVVLSGKEVVYR
jgi:hypothetical protein